MNGSGGAIKYAQSRRCGQCRRQVQRRQDKHRSKHWKEGLEENEANISGGALLCAHNRGLIVGRVTRQSKRPQLCGSLVHGALVREVFRHRQLAVAQPFFLLLQGG
jgi:hypothetical protein